MKIYDETSHDEIFDPDLTKGYLYDGTIVTGYTEETTEVMEGTVTEERPEGLVRLIPSRPIVEECQYYHTYTEEEVEEIRNAKIDELLAAQDAAIAAGTDILLSDGSTKHFNYGDGDQADVSDMFNAVSIGMAFYIYHANNDNCEVYSTKDIIIIYSTLSSLKTAQKTYCNQLCMYVKTLTTVPEIQAVTYGQELTGRYLEKYNELVEISKAEMQSAIEKLPATSG